jgi:hypothetical protein
MGNTMLDLDSQRWRELSAAVDPMLVPQRIRQLEVQPTENDWAELWEDISHQGTLYSSAYAAVPHLIRLGTMQGLTGTPLFLFSLGRIAAPYERDAPLPPDLKADFDAALKEAAAIALQAAQDALCSPVEYISGPLYAAAALSGRLKLAYNLNLTAMWQEPEPELHCPKCDAYLLGTFEAGDLSVQSVDSRMKPLSDKARVVPRRPSTIPWDDKAQPADDFDWLVALCRKARQNEVLGWVCCLFGSVRCPLCAAEFVVMQQVEREALSGTGEDQ